MRGLSEMVGAALLIAVVMFAGTLVATWGTTWVSKERTTLLCVGRTNYVVESARFDTDSRELIIKITSFGTEPIYGFGLTLYNGSDSKQFNYTDVEQGGISRERRLRREESTYISVNIEDTLFGRTIERIIVTNEACDGVTTEGKLKSWS